MQTASTGTDVDPTTETELMPLLRCTRCGTGLAGRGAAITCPRRGHVCARLGGRTLDMRSDATTLRERRDHDTSMEGVIKSATASEDPSPFAKLGATRPQVRTLEDQALVRGRRVLDVGGGYGRLLAPMSAHAPRLLVGIDVSFNTLAAAEGLIQQEGAASDPSRSHSTMDTSSRFVMGRSTSSARRATSFTFPRDTYGA